MLQTSEINILDRVSFLTGSVDVVEKLTHIKSRRPFENEIIDFLDDVSKVLMKEPANKAYPDIITFAFWIRKAATMRLKTRFMKADEIYMGKGVVFHIAPSNVPVNFAYTFVSGLLCGNINIVRVPSKTFAQVNILIENFKLVLEKYPDIKPYVVFVQYERDKMINDYFSQLADVRVIWGGDRTIEELRMSPVKARTNEITFADRFSIAVIDSEKYLQSNKKSQIAREFYNDTYLTDQNACTSPRIVIWMGEKIKEAKVEFWRELHDLVEDEYKIQPVQVISKLTTTCRVSAAEEKINVEECKDNLITRVKIENLTENLMDYRDNSGYFYEYDCKDIMELAPIVNDKRCQTIAYIGNKEVFLPLVFAGVKGIDRIVPIGKTMDYDLIWDGENLFSLLTRTISVM